MSVPPPILPPCADSFCSHQVHACVAKIRGVEEVSAAAAGFEPAPVSIPARYECDWSRAASLERARKAVPLEYMVCANNKDDGGGGKPRFGPDMCMSKTTFEDAAVLNAGSISVAVAATVRDCARLPSGSRVAIVYTMLPGFRRNCLEVAAYVHAQVQRVAAHGTHASLVAPFSIVLGVTTALPNIQPAAQTTISTKTSTAVQALAAVSDAVPVIAVPAAAGFLVMRLADATLHERNQFQQVTGGLKACVAAHVLQLHHGDMRCANLGVDAEGAVMVLDWELSTWANRGPHALAAVVGDKAAAAFRVPPTAVWFCSETGCVCGEASPAVARDVNVKALLSATFLENWDLAFFVAGLAVKHASNPLVEAVFDAVFKNKPAGVDLDAATADVRRMVFPSQSPRDVLLALFKLQTRNAAAALAYFVYPDALQRAVQTWQAHVVGK